MTGHTRTLTSLALAGFLLAASSLAAAVGFPDLMQVFGKTTLNQTGQAVEVIGITMAVYLVISLGISALVHRSEAGRWRA